MKANGGKRQGLLEQRMIRSRRRSSFIITHEVRLRRIKIYPTQCQIATAISRPPPRVPQVPILHLGSWVPIGRPTHKAQAVCCGEAAIKWALEREKILQKLLTRLRKHRLGMELHALQFVLPVAHTHDDAVVGFRGDRKLARQ